MRLTYYHGRVPNFGDDLNGVLWPALRPDLFDESETVAFVGIGTIIGFPCAPYRQLNVFSSGAGNDPLGRWADRDVTFWCVRGPITAALLGLEADRALCDGAILAPLVPSRFPAAHHDSGEILLIPHWQTLDDPGWEEAARLAGYVLLDPRGSPEAVIGRIARARMVLTESLHGAILADTYGVPWAAFATSGNFQASKWLDWTRSLGRGFEFTIVPPPSATGFLRYGRPMAAIGTSVSVTDAIAMRDMRGRTEQAARPAVTAKARVKARVKAWVKRSGLLNRFYDMSPARTAEALTGLARAVRQPSTPGTITQLQTRMMERLDQVGRGGR
ncbi:succinoglycan biosynthesis protein ExoV [Methylobacterium sp. RAS18]|nr:succinoglycan biosynthesis protein ExoV [Methylobacterium sp. RAS18]